MNGQLSVFDVHNTKLRPCDYRFKRFIGQEFLVNGKIAKCVRIEPYYTIVDDGEREYALTPTTAVPRKEIEE